MRFEEALEIAKSKRQKINPNAGKIFFKNKKIINFLYRLCKTTKAV